jgi:hypothetical protein
LFERNHRDTHAREMRRDEIEIETAGQFVRCPKERREGNHLIYLQYAPDVNPKNTRNKMDTHSWGPPRPFGG